MAYRFAHHDAVMSEVPYFWASALCRRDGWEDVRNYLIQAQPTITTYMYMYHNLP